MSTILRARRPALPAGATRTALLSLFLALAWIVNPAATPARAASPVARAVVVVGPTEGVTASYIRDARRIAAQLRSYGARVTEIYSPNATWSRVRAAAKGANLLVYLGHGNGFPNPYGPFDPKKVDGMGLNTSTGHGNTNKHYYGEYYMRTLALAPGAVVILNHACYTAGSSEPGRALPTLGVARKRADYYAAGFISAGAVGVLATAGSPASFIASLFRTSRSLQAAFWAAPDTSTRYDSTFASVRRPGMRGILAPYPSRHYYFSIVGRLTSTATAWRATWRP